MRFRSITFVFAVLLLTAGSGFAFDGQRKGKILGMGFGLTPAAPRQVTRTATAYSPGWSFRMFLGYAWSDQDMITLNVSANTVYSSKDPNGIDIGCHYRSLEYSHYFDPGHRSWFYKVAFGAVHWDWGDAKPGVGFGGGYAFLKGFQLQIDAVVGPGESNRDSSVKGFIRLELVGMIY